MAADSKPYDGPLLISAPGKVILFGEHAVVYKKVRAPKLRKIIIIFHVQKVLPNSLAVK